jgi:hypothetical protein
MYRIKKRVGMFSLPYEVIGKTKAVNLPVIDNLIEME